MNIDEAKENLINGLKIKVYGEDLLLCNESNTSLKIMLRNGASYYANSKDVYMAQIKLDINSNL